MSNDDLLTMLKSNLQMVSTSFDTYLTQLISVAKQEISREGITLDESENSDCNLIVMYAAYLYRKRAADNPVMPRMLRYALNNRVFAEKMRS